MTVASPAGVLAVSECDLDKKNGAAAAKYETATVLLRVDCAAAARCLLQFVRVLISWPPGKLNSGIETDRMCVVFESCPVPETDAFSSGHDWKGVSKDKEREVPASFEFTQTKDVPVSSFGTLLGALRRLCCASSGRRDRSPSSTKTSGMQSLLSLSSRSKQQPHWKEGTVADASSCVRSGTWEAPNVQPGKHRPVFRQGKRGHVDLCREEGHVEEVLHGVGGGGELGDVCATIGGKLVDINSTLSACGVTPDCTVRLHARIRGGSRENVPGQRTCSNCFADRCWPVRTR